MQPINWIIFYLSEYSKLNLSKFIQFKKSNNSTIISQVKCQIRDQNLLTLLIFDFTKYIDVYNRENMLLKSNTILRKVLIIYIVSHANLNNKQHKFEIINDEYRLKQKTFKAI